MSLSTLTVKALLIILPKRSLTESRQCQERKKQCEDAAHEGENKGNKSLWGLLRVWGTQESIPCPPLLGGPAYGHKHQRVLNSTNATNCLEPLSK